MGKPEEEDEEDDDPGPVDTKPECEATCKPRCVKQLLVYEVSVVFFFLLIVLLIATSE